MGRITGQPVFCISVLLLMIFFATGCGNADSRDNDPSNHSGMTDALAGGEQRRQVTLRITGMSWGAWPRIVQLALERLDGVHKSEVSLRSEQAAVTYTPEKVTVQQMIEAVRQSGFGAEKAP